jgi:hypothetical protein
MKKVNKYMKAIEIGRLMPNDSNNDIIEESRVFSFKINLILIILY